MLRRLLLATLFAISAALLAAPAANAQYGDDAYGDYGDAGGGDSAGEAAQDAGAGGEEVVLDATLSGAEEVPDPGDPDGTGTAKIWLQGDQVRFALTWENIQTPATLAHIHVGAAGEAGDPVVTLFGDGGAATEGTVTADAEVVQRIIDNPGGYYVNVHNGEFPAGAVRGQLAAGAGGGGELPFTGPSSPYLLLIGFTVVLAGALLLIGSRRYGVGGKHLAKHMAGRR